MATLQELEAYRRALQDARFSGVRRVRDANGEEVEFKSDSELSRAMIAVEREIAWQSRAIPSSTLRFQTSKGL